MEKFFISKNNFNISSKQIKKNCERKIQQINEKSKNKSEDFVQLAKILNAAAMTVEKQLNENTQVWKEIWSVKKNDFELDAIDLDIDNYEKMGILWDLTEHVEKIAFGRTNTEEIIAKIY